MPQQRQTMTFPALIELRARAIAREVDRITGGQGDDRGWAAFVVQAEAIAAAERAAGLAVVPAAPVAAMLDSGAASLIENLTTEMEQASFQAVAGGCYGAMVGTGDLLRETRGR